MRILSVLTYYYPHWTGLTAHAVHVAEGLAARGHQVTVLTTRHIPELARDENVNGVRVIRLKAIARYSRGMLTIAFPLAVAKLIPQHDVVQIHTPLPEAPLVALLCRFFRRPLLMTHHGDVIMPTGFINQLIQRAGYLTLLAAGALADGVTSYSRDYAEHSRLLQNFKNKLSYIYPPVSMPEPDPAGIKLWRAELGLDDSKLIGFAGRWVEEKGFDYLLQAFPGVQEAFPNAHLIYAGDPHVVYEDFFDKCRPLLGPLRENVTILGLVRDPQKMANFYGMCDVFVQPSRTDMMGLVQIEAMLCGTPVVVSDIPGARVVMQETGYGRLSAPRDPQALARTIIEVIQNRRKYEPDRSKARMIFGMEQSLNQYEGLMKRLVSGEATAPLPARSFVARESQVDPQGESEKL